MSVPSRRDLVDAGFEAHLAPLRSQLEEVRQRVMEAGIAAGLWDDPRAWPWWMGPSGERRS